MGKRAVIKEIVLENFMSYEYARIPLSPGLNIISGPNGSGKSSILLAISVALGQTYTERSKRLSDLIRKGKDIARVSLLLDNKFNGNRLIECKSDTLLLSRYIKRDGSYWYEVDFREVSKFQIDEIFRKIGLNPNNMLIIMHQNMIQEFALIPPQEKLMLLEEVVGFGDYRKKIKGAMEKLSSLLKEEDAVSQMLGDAEQTLSYWKEVYEKYLEKKSLVERLEYLEREIVWAKYIRQEKTLRSLNEKLKGKKSDLSRIKKRIKDAKARIAKTEAKRRDAKLEQRKYFYSLLEAEKEKARIEAAQENGARIKELKQRISVAQAKLGEIEDKIEEVTNEYVNRRIARAILEYQKRGIEGEIKNLEGWVRECKGKLSSINIEIAGERIDTERTIKEIERDISLTKAKAEAIGDVPEEAGRMYSDYSELYKKLKKRMDEVRNNRERAMEAVQERKKIWKRELRKLISKINPVFSRILEKMDAKGKIRLFGLEEIEKAGMDILVGFKGAELSVLDYRTQSGGERSTTIAAFLLALQQYSLSPFSAMDEFDVHMDMRNREIIYQAIVSSVRKSGIQYLAITPRPLITEKDVNFIVVQNVHGKSRVRQVA